MKDIKLELLQVARRLFDEGSSVEVGLNVIREHYDRESKDKSSLDRFVLPKRLGSLRQPGLRRKDER